MITFDQVSKEYHVGGQIVKALDKVSFEIQPQKLTIILGPSGSGKSTLLNILGGMDRPTNGLVKFNNEIVSNLTDHELTDYRRDIVGFVFQFYNLIPSLTALENVAIAAQLKSNAHNAKQYLQQVGLSHRLNNFPNQMSGGEMQRVSIARALSKQPVLYYSVMISINDCHYRFLVSGIPLNKKGNCPVLSPQPAIVLERIYSS